MARLLSGLALALLAVPAFAASGDPRIRGAPHHGGPATTFIVAFTAPDAAGHQGVFQRSYQIDASAPQQRSCAFTTGSAVNRASKGERVRVRLRPGGRSRWCEGLYKGTISFEEGPFCERGQPCPAFATRIRTIGHFHFRVR
jgi:hypothetical protein